MSTESNTHTLGGTSPETVLGRVDEAICAFDDDWQVTFVNDQAAAMLEYTPEELLGRDIQTVVPTLHETVVGDRLREAMSTGTPTRFEHYDEAGDRWFQIRIYPDDDGATACFYDITDERSDELESHRQRRLFETVFEETEDALIVADTNRRITDFNPAAEQLFGYDASEVIGESTRLLYADTDEYDRQGDQRFNEHAPMREETYLVEYERADGTTFIGESLGTSLKGPDGGTLAFLGSVRDASARIEYEQTLEAHNDTLQTFHDISTDDDRSVDERIDAVLELGCEHLGLDIGILSAVADTDYTVEQVDAPDDSIQPGEQFDLAETFCDRVVDSGELVAVTDAGNSDLAEHPAYKEQGLESYLGVEVIVDGERYGTLNFSQSVPREQPFTESERTLVRLFAQWIGKELSRQQNKRRAAANRDRLRQIIDLLPQLVFAKDRSNEFILANQAVADAYGTTVEDVEGSTDADFLASAAEAEQFRQDDLAVIDSGEPKHIPEEPLTKANGETVTLQTIKIPYDPVDHDKEAVLGVATDITEMVEQRQELEETSQRLNIALESTNTGVWEFDLETGEIVWTNSMESLVGLDFNSDDDVYDSLIDRVHPADRDAVQETLGSVSELGETIQMEYRFEQGDGTYLWVEARAELVGDAETDRRLVGIVTDISDRKSRDAEIELQSAAMEVAMDGIAILDGDEYVYMNQAHANIFDYEPEELIGLEWRDLYGDDEIERLEAEVFPELADTGSWRGETVGKKQDGTSVTQDLGLALLDSGELICTNRDITAQKQREEELQQQRSRIRALFDNSPDGIVIHDADGAVLDVNETTADTLGYDRETLCSMNVAEFEAGIDRSELVETWAEMEPNETLKVEGEHRRQNGKTFPVEVWVNKVEVGGDDRYIAVDRDITDRKQREAELKRSREFIEKAQESAAIGGWEVDLRTDEIRWTDEVYRIHDLPTDAEMTVDRAFEFYPPDDKDTLTSAFERLTTEGESYDLEVRLTTAEGRERWVRVAGDPQFNDDGEVIKVVGITQEISERKVREQELERSRDFIEKSQQSASIGGWEVDLETESLRWTDEVYRIHEVSTDTAVELEDGLGFYHPDDSAEIEAAFDRLVEEGEPYDLELRIVTANERVRWVRTVGSPQFDDDGTITGALGIFQNITEQKQLETSLRESEQSLRELTSIASDTDRGFEDKLRALLELGTERLGLPYGFLNRIDNEAQNVVQAVGDHPELQTGASAPKEETYCRKTIEQSTPLSIQNAVDEGWEGDAAYERFDLGCYIGGSVTVDGSPYGTLCFADRQHRDHEFTDSERTFVELLVQWISHELSRAAIETKLRQINETGQQFMSVPSKEQIASLAIESAESILDVSAIGLWWYDEDRDALVPEQMSEAATEYVSEQPVFERGTALAWEAFDTGEVRVYDDLSAVDGMYNKQTAFNSETIVPLGSYGVLCAGSTEYQSFSETRVNLLNVLSSTVEAAIARAERETELRETQAALKQSNEVEVETGRLNAYGSDTDFFVQDLSISRARDLI